jgi:hypothetical protein
MYPEINIPLQFNSGIRITFRTVIFPQLSEPRGDNAPPVQRYGGREICHYFETFKGFLVTQTHTRDIIKSYHLMELMLGYAVEDSELPIDSRAKSLFGDTGPRKFIGGREGW